MRHRIGIANMTGLGNADKCILDNKWSTNENLNNVLKNMFEEAIPLYFKDLNGCDFQIVESEKDIAIYFGYEPAYKMEKLKILKICMDKSQSYYQSGIAYGAYGSDIVSTTKIYGDYKNKSKFVKFVDKWHSELEKVINLPIN